MIVHDLDAFRPRIRPTKANTALVVDTDAVLTFPIPLERFQMIARRGGQELKRRRRLKLRQLARGNLEYRRETLRLPGLEKRLRVAAAKAPDHRPRI